MSTNIFSRLSLPDLTVTPDVMNLSESKRRRLLRGVAKLREAAAAEIDRLLDFLDRTELDSDFEPVGDAEPSLGSPEIPLHNAVRLSDGRWYALPSTQDGWAKGGYADLERDTDIEEDDQLDHGELDKSDDEPSLGSIESAGRQSQAGWGLSATHDREGPEDDLEWSIGYEEREG